jgi:phosphatidylserine/phosphatidylglycerophosphate/cardiolipin synthase-like enzyme/uncharacterized membrane protein YdjX (TVP38/TMEM64 family)
MTSTGPTASTSPSLTLPEIVRPGENCWRREHATRAAVLVDAERCFTAMHGAMRQARRSILIVGWDIHSGIGLRRGDGGDEEALGDFLVSRIHRRRSLRVHVLVWNFAMLYAVERQLMPFVSRHWRLPWRLKFRYDARHPVGACHHQKIVVVDDSVAFVGGLDLTARRWDTREHLAADPRRIDPWGGAYGPFHDIQMLVEGDAAAAIGALVRARWARVSRRPRPVATRWRGDRWPADVVPDVRDVPVAIARTMPPWRDEAAIREVERLYVEAIAAAERVIYLENQYLTSHTIAAALAARLGEPYGPEVVIIGPAVCSGWLEEHTMGVVRTNLLRGLRDADAHGRLRIYAPHAADDPTVPVTVHSKIMVVDDRYLHVGSANLNNRSMRLDSECDLGVEASRPDAVAGVAAVRDGLIAEHLHLPIERVQATMRQTAGLGEAIDRLRPVTGTLQPIEIGACGAIDSVLPAVLPVDPERPLVPPAILGEWLWPSTVTETGGRRRWSAVVAVAVVGLAMALWRVTHAGDVMAPERIANAASSLAGSPWGPVVGTLGIAVASTMMVPLVPLVVAAGVLLGPWTGFAVALTGGTAAALAGHEIGRVLWRDATHRLLGRYADRLARRLRRGSVLAVMAVRIVPVAPFAVVNFAAGATHVPRRAFMLGTILGLAPGALALTVASDRGIAVARHPNWHAAAALGVAVLALIALAAGGRAILARRAV